MSSIRDFYTKSIDSPNFDDTRIEVNDELSLLIIKIENILFTKPGSVLGDFNYGVDLDGLIFSLVLSESTISRRIENQIATYCLNGNSRYNVGVNVEFFSTPERNGAIIDININNKKVLGILF